MSRTEMVVGSLWACLCIYVCSIITFSLCGLFFNGKSKLKVISTIIQTLEKKILLGTYQRSVIISRNGLIYTILFPFIQFTSFYQSIYFKFWLRNYNKKNIPLIDKIDLSNYLRCYNYCHISYPCNWGAIV